MNFTIVRRLFLVLAALLYVSTALGSSASGDCRSADEQTTTSLETVTSRTQCGTGQVQIRCNRTDYCVAPGSKCCRSGASENLCLGPNVECLSCGGRVHCTVPGQICCNGNQVCAPGQRCEAGRCR